MEGHQQRLGFVYTRTITGNVRFLFVCLFIEDLDSETFGLKEEECRNAAEKLWFHSKSHRVNRVLEKKLLLPINLEGFMVISKIFGVHCFAVRKIIHKWKMLETVTNLPRSQPIKFTPRLDSAMLREIGKNPRVSSQTLPASVSR